jgi:outer membrane protein assembly factor BamD
VICVRKVLRYAAAIGMVWMFVGCGGGEETGEFNKPALYWYAKTADSIATGNLDKADEYYISLKSEHMNSPLLPTATLMLAYAHMKEEEYLLANFYFDEFSKRFADEAHYEYIDFMKLKASFSGVKDIYRDQALILDTIEKAKTYEARYPGSEYTPLVNTIRVRLEMALYLLNENIAALYDRIGKPEAAKIYRAKNKDSLVEQADIIPPEKGIIGKIFD